MSLDILKVTNLPYKLLVDSSYLEFPNGPLGFYNVGFCGTVYGETLAAT